MGPGVQALSPPEKREPRGLMETGKVDCEPVEAEGEKQPRRGRHKALKVELMWCACRLPASPAAAEQGAALAGPFAQPGWATLRMIREWHFGRDGPRAGNMASAIWQHLQSDGCTHPV